MKKDQDMHWFLWEALCMEIGDMARKGIIPKAMLIEADEITRLTRESGKFSIDLRQRAFALAEGIDPFYNQWLAAIDKEQRDMMRFLMLDAAITGKSEEGIMDAS